MKILFKKYQYWWDTGEGFALEEFDKTSELLELISAYPSNNFYITQKPGFMPGIDIQKWEKGED